MQNATRPNRPDLDATKVPTDIDIAWAAGIYEGEGHCRLCGKTKRGIAATVTQKDPELLYRLREWFGGRVAIQSPKHQVHVWECNGDRCRTFLALIYGFMTARRKAQIDATNVFEFIGTGSPVGLNAAQIRSELARFYAEHAEEVKERRRKARAAKYLEYAADPEWVKKDRQKKAEKLAAMTDEERKAWRNDRNHKYLAKKNELQNVSGELQHELHILESMKSA